MVTLVGFALLTMFVAVTWLPLAVENAPQAAAKAF